MLLYIHLFFFVNVLVNFFCGCGTWQRKLLHTTMYNSQKVKLTSNSSEVAVLYPFYSSTVKSYRLSKWNPIVPVGPQDHLAEYLMPHVHKMSEEEFQKSQTSFVSSATDWLAGKLKQAAVGLKNWFVSKGKEGVENYKAAMKDTETNITSIVNEMHQMDEKTVEARRLMEYLFEQAVTFRTKEEARSKIVEQMKQLFDIVSEIRGKADFTYKKVVWVTWNTKTDLTKQRAEIKEALDSILENAWAVEYMYIQTEQMSTISPSDELQTLKKLIVNEKFNDPSFINPILEKLNLIIPQIRSYETLLTGLDIAIDDGRRRSFLYNYYRIRNFFVKGHFPTLFNDTTNLKTFFVDSSKHLYERCLFTSSIVLQIIDYRNAFLYFKETTGVRNYQARLNEWIAEKDLTYRDDPNYSYDKLVTMRQGKADKLKLYFDCVVHLSNNTPMRAIFIETFNDVFDSSFDISKKEDVATKLFLLAIGGSDERCEQVSAADFPYLYSILNNEKQIIGVMQLLFGTEIVPFKTIYDHSSAQHFYIHEAHLCSIHCIFMPFDEPILKFEYRMCPTVLNGHHLPPIPCYKQIPILYPQPSWFKFTPPNPTSILRLESSVVLSNPTPYNYPYDPRHNLFFQIMDS